MCALAGFGAIRVISVWLLVAGLLATRVYKLFRLAAFPGYKVQRVKCNKIVWRPGSARGPAVELTGVLFL